MKILPHRFPMLLVDRITDFEPMKFARGYKNISLNEPIFSGHFPGNPVMPGVYIIEAMAQVGGIAILASGDMARKVPYLAGIDRAKFRRPVVPGDQLMMEATVTSCLFRLPSIRPRSPTTRRSCTNDPSDRDRPSIGPDRPLR